MDTNSIFFNIANIFSPFTDFQSANTHAKGQPSAVVELNWQEMCVFVGSLLLKCAFHKLTDKWSKKRIRRVLHLRALHLLKSARHLSETNMCLWKLFNLHVLLQPIPRKKNARAFSCLFFLVLTRYQFGNVYFFDFSFSVIRMYIFFVIPHA